MMRQVRHPACLYGITGLYLILLSLLRRLVLVLLFERYRILLLII